MWELKDVRPYAGPVVVAGAAMYLGATFVTIVNAEEARHIPAGALVNLATGPGSIAPSSGTAALTMVGGMGYQHMPNTIAEGEFKMPAAPERGMLGHHNEQC